MSTQRESEYLVQDWALHFSTVERHSTSSLCQHKTDVLQMQSLMLSQQKQLFRTKKMFFDFKALYSIKNNFSIIENNYLTKMVLCDGIWFYIQLFIAGVCYIF